MFGKLIFLIILSRNRIEFKELISDFLAWYYGTSSYFQKFLYACMKWSGISYYINGLRKILDRPLVRKGVIFIINGQNRRSVKWVGDKRYGDSLLSFSIHPWTHQYIQSYLSVRVTKRSCHVVVSVSDSALLLTSTTILSIDWMQMSGQWIPVFIPFYKH